MCKQEFTNCSYIIILKSALQNTWFSIFIICIVVNLQCMINSHAKLGIVILLNIISVFVLCKKYNLLNLQTYFQLKLKQMHVQYI